MNIQELIKQLEEHLKQIESNATQLYVIQLKKLIENLKSGLYDEDEILIRDLQSLGFQDLAQQVRRRRFL